MKDRDGADKSRDRQAAAKDRAERAKKESIAKDFEHCVTKHTLNGDGFNGASGDLATAKCIVDRVAERTTENIMKDRDGGRNSGGGENCIVSSIIDTKYENLFLQNNSLETLLSIYRLGGIDAVNMALAGQSIDWENLLADI